MDQLHCDGSIYINRPIDEVFDFICNPDVDLAELTPMEDEVTESNVIRGVGATIRLTVEFAARKLTYVCRCVEYTPPHRLAQEFEGELEGMQTWHLRPEGEHTLAHLMIDLVLPKWTPAYLHDKTTAEHWGQMLVDQTLNNVKSAIER
ncbi:MAG: SRPBCC family protein [Chloroflexi bacterium]|nr:SRPBCC family protein [Chloroflexota bacterium]